MKNVYICHPYAGDPERNVEKVKGIVRKIAVDSINDMVKDEALNTIQRAVNVLNNEVFEDSIVCPVCPLLAFPHFMSEPEVTREHGMAFCLSLLDACDELWVVSDNVTEGMKEEITFASENGIPVRWKC